MDLNFELAPTQGMTESQRLLEFKTARFLDVRNLGVKHYKKTDGTPLMSFNESLDEREKIKRTIIEFEISMGWVVRDAVSAAAPSPMNGVIPPQPQPQGDSSMQMPFPPPNQSAPTQQPQPQQDR